jgi:Uncharacterized protein conserved in bacteria (DUF2252)
VTSLEHLMPIADAPVSPRQRGPALESLRNQKMARSTLDYVRGSPMQFYEWLEKGSAAIPEGPEVWICGDCHVGNLGPVANADVDQEQISATAVSRASTLALQHQESILGRGFGYSAFRSRSSPS